MISTVFCGWNFRSLAIPTPFEIYFDRYLWDSADDKALELFDRASRMVSREWYVQQSRTDGSVATRVAWLESVSYRLLKAIIESDSDYVGGADIELFDRRSAQFGRDRGAKGANANLFQKGLMALFAHDKGAITPRDRERIEKRLWHAYRHFVPPTFLAGFFQTNTERRALATNCVKRDRAGV